ncbi:MAG: VanZ family protein [Gammaproteobacteria bacterium]|nr:VanZ family protein [Gammaproteobacteria bacterium]
MQKADLKWFKVWLWVGFALIALIIGLSLTSKPIHIGFHMGDKVAHGLGYAVVMGWFLQLYPGRVARALLALAFVAMGASLEFLQGLNPMRYFDWWDMLANAVGVILAWLSGFTVLGQLLLRFERWWIKT